MRVFLFVLWVLMIPVAILKRDESQARESMARMIFGRSYEIRYAILISPFIAACIAYSGYGLFKESLVNLDARSAKSAQEVAEKTVAKNPRLVVSIQKAKPVQQVAPVPKSQDNTYYNYFVFNTIADCREHVLAERGYQDFGGCDISVVGDDALSLSNKDIKPTGFVFAFARDSIKRSEETKFYFPMYKNQDLNKYQYGSGHLAKASGFYLGRGQKFNKEKLFATMIGAKDSVYPYQVIEVKHPETPRPSQSIEVRMPEGARVSTNVAEQADSKKDKLELLPKAEQGKASYNFHVFNEVSQCEAHVRANAGTSESKIDCGASFPSNSPMSLVTDEKYELSGLVAVVKRKARIHDKNKLSYYPVFKLSNLSLASPELPLYIYSNGQETHNDGFYRFKLSEVTIKRLFI